MLINIWKAHDSSPWQNKFYQWNSKSLIEADDSNPWQFIQSPILIGNIKAQFSLALSYQKRKEPKTIKAWQRKKIMLPKQKGPLQVFMKKPKNKCVFTNKSPWGIKTHGNMCTQLSPCDQETPAEGKGE